MIHINFALIVNKYVAKNVNGLTMNLILCALILILIFPIIIQKDVLNVQGIAIYAHVRENNYTVYDEKEEEKEQLLKQTIEKMRQEDEVIIRQMKDIKESLEELDKIALKPRVLTNAEYFQQMIDYEKKQKRAGYLKRIEELEMMKNQA